MVSSTMSTSTLATNINNVVDTWLGYIGVFLTNYYPFLIGALVIVGVIVLSIALLKRLFHA